MDRSPARSLLLLPVLLLLPACDYLLGTGEPIVIPEPEFEPIRVEDPETDSSAAVAVVVTPRGGGRYDDRTPGTDSPGGKSLRLAELIGKNRGKGLDPNRNLYLRCAEDLPWSEARAVVRAAAEDPRIEIGRVRFWALKRGSTYVGTVLAWVPGAESIGREPADLFPRARLLVLHRGASIDREAIRDALREVSAGSRVVLIADGTVPTGVVVRALAASRAHEVATVHLWLSDPPPRRGAAAVLLDGEPLGRAK